MDGAGLKLHTVTLLVGLIPPFIPYKPGDCVFPLLECYQSNAHLCGFHKLFCRHFYIFVCCLKSNYNLYFLSSVSAHIAVPL